MNELLALTLSGNQVIGIMVIIVVVLLLASAAAYREGYNHGKGGQ